ncbi:hypothetical protein KY385_01555 [Candidatus Parcubacteria bacterium]|nr:hypothetical protein [Candidatus Parcubacteria bacterium]
MNYTFIKFDSTNPEHREAASSIAAWSAESSTKRFEGQGYSGAGERQPPSPTGCDTIVSFQIQ